METTGTPTNGGGPRGEAVGPFAPVEPGSVRAALDRVLASEAFANAGRLSRFLRFTVEQTLDGQGDRLKEYVLGVEVFDRTDTFDPRIDSIVRVEARRLRGKLAEYYEIEGASDPVLIRLRKGSYVPRFEIRNGAPQPVEPAGSIIPAVARSRPRTLALIAIAVAALAVAGVLVRSRAAGPASQVAVRTSVAVLPFAHFSSDPRQEALADRLTDGVISELARFPELAVRSRTSVMQYRGARVPLRDVAAALAADVVMEASVSSDRDQVRIEARLVRASSDSKFWVDELVGAPTELPALARRVAHGAAAAIEERRQRRSP